jgi:hypothetical protein
MHDPDASLTLRHSYYVFQTSKPTEEYQHTLQPSQSFFTELLTFIPRTCSCTLFTTSIRLVIVATALLFIPIVGLRTEVVLNAALLKRREDIEVRHACSDCEAGRTTVRKVRAVRRRACCVIVILGCRRLRPIDSRQLGGLLRYDVDLLELRTQNRNSNRDGQYFNLRHKCVGDMHVMSATCLN